MASTDIDICNSALVLCGAEQINTFEDSTREARICAQLYEMTKNAELQAYPWFFTLAQASLARLVDTPLFDYEYAYQLPVDCLRLIRKDGMQNDYRVFEDKLYSNSSEVKVIYQIDPDEQDFPDYFTLAVVYKMAMVLATSLLKDPALAQSFQRLYQQQSTMAKQIASSETPTRQLPAHNFVLTAIRGSDG